VKKRLLFLLLILFSSISIAYSQKIEIDVTNMPLNKVLIGLRETYHLKFSFNDQLLTRYNVTVKNSYSNAEEAVHSLIKVFPLTCLQRGDVFIILPESKESNPRIFQLTGQVIESNTDESLPYAQLAIDDRLITSDEKGSFSYTGKTDSIFHVKISYLGHYVLDTIVYAGNNHRFRLTPSNIGLQEVIVTGQSIENTTLIGNKAGAMKINNQVARFLPGNDDNSVFNLLRLMPGILASSEQSNGLIIWGSYEGQSQVIFDGFTIWGLKSFNDDINTVNPLITKDMEVLKGGYDASYGDRVGGIVRITGKNGNNQKPSVTLNVNNVTMDGAVELPVWHNSSVMLSFRQTYYNLYQGKQILPVSPRLSQLIDYTVHPDYNFHDANFKFTSTNDKGGLFYISMLGGEDQFKYTLERSLINNQIFRTKGENNRQAGASMFYGNTWQNGNISNFIVSWSGLETDLTDVQKVFRTNNSEVIRRNDLTTNHVSEYSIKTDNWISVNKSNRIETGGGFELNNVGLVADSSGVNQTSLNDISQRFNAFVQDHLSLPGNFNITAGFRGDYPTNLRNVYFQPRLSASLGITEAVKINLAWGIYNQFITKSSVLDDNGNYRYIWTSCNNKDVPVLKATHWVAGTSYQKNDFTFSVETYYKNTEGLTRFININQKIRNKIFQGEDRSYGIDLFLKKDYHGHSAWLSYTLSKTEEKFSYFLKDEYTRAPQDQRHEIKGAVLLNIKPFRFSANYVFGSGFPLNTGTVVRPSLIEPDYNRLDVALIYLFRIKKVMGETGLSILNVFNSQNIRYSNFEKVPLDQTNSINIYSEAVPFSPRLTLKLSL